MNEFAAYFERLRRTYFSDPGRHFCVPKGCYLMRQGRPNDKIFYVLTGMFSSTIQMENILGRQETLELQQSGPGSIQGIRCFFTEAGLAFFDVVATFDSEVAWIDRETLPVDRETHGNLKEQFLPLLMRDIQTRQSNFIRAAKQSETSLMRLHVAENMATLGQFAAGIAHELNNTTGVLVNSSGHLQKTLTELFAAYAPDLAVWFERGRAPGKSLSSAEIRTRARKLMQKNSLSYETAKDIVMMSGDDEAPDIPGNMAAARLAWNAGRSCGEIGFSAEHAANVIRSIRQLSSGGQGKRTPVDLRETVEQSMSLLCDDIKGVTVLIDAAPSLPSIVGNSSEFIQIWSNIIKNAVEAMRDAGTPNPRIAIDIRARDEELCVSIANNGPPIPPYLRDRLFQPSITTKTGRGQSMGLGLGLNIVKKLVESYQGRIRLSDTADETTFVVSLPLR